MQILLIYSKNQQKTYFTSSRGMIERYFLLLPKLKHWDKYFASPEWKKLATNQYWPTKRRRKYAYKCNMSLLAISPATKGTRSTTASLVHRRISLLINFRDWYQMKSVQLFPAAVSRLMITNIFLRMLRNKIEEYLQLATKRILIKKT